MDAITLKRKWRLVDLAVVFSLAALVLACAWIYRDFPQDDAFITYRYARNLARGQGFVYNPGEYVLGTTTPLYTMLLALLNRLSGQDLRVISHVLSMGSLWLGGLVLYRLGGELNPAPAAGSAVVYVTSPLLISNVGMETLFLLALALVAIHSYLAGRRVLAGVLLGLLLLTRYETVLLLAVLVVHDFIRRRRTPFWVSGAVLTFLPWAIFAVQSFGHVVPQSASAKLVERAAGHGIPFAEGALVWWNVYLAQSRWYLVYLPLLLLGTYSLLRTRPIDTAFRLILAWSLSYFFLASLVAGSFSWYYGPLFPLFSILIALGARFVGEFAADVATLAPSLRQARVVLHSAFLFLVLLGIVALQVSSWLAGWVLHEGRVTDTRYVCHREVAQWLSREGGEGASLAALEIGVIGYYTELRIVDLFGLVTPEIAPWLSQGTGQVVERAIASFQPDYVLNISAEGYESIQTFGSGRCVLYGRDSGR